MKLETLFSEQNMRTLKAFMDSLDVGIWVNNGNGDVLYASRGIEEQYGVSPTEIIGKNARKIVDDGLSSQYTVQATIKTRQIVHTTVMTRIGKTITSSTYPLLDEKGRLWRVLGCTKQHFEQESEDIPGPPTLGAVQQPVNKADDPFVFQSEAMRNIMISLERAAKSDAIVMILGESGVGKDRIARMLHDSSPRAEKPYVVVNCAAIPENLIESELFGYEKGAFTGAFQSHMGLLELANGGTVFLDEIGDLPVMAQVKLLRCIQNRQVMRLGGKKVINLDVRFISATNQALERMVEEGRFREDLYFRLNVIKLRIPPLRERTKDIIPLMEFFLDKFNKYYGRNKEFSKTSLKILQNYTWPGNVRELENTVEHAVVLCPNRIIHHSYIPDYIQEQSKKYSNESIISYKDAFEEWEKGYFTEVARHYSSSRKVAAVLEIDQTTVLRKMKKYGLL